MRKGIFQTLVLVTLVICAVAIQAADENVATFSIVGFDPETGELGVAVASRFFTVGNVVPWAKTGVGAVATQAYANTSFGWRGLDLMEKGATAQEAMDILIRNDDKPHRRQVGIVDAAGNSATHTGDGCSAWAGGRKGPNYACQGNILAGEAVVVAMEEAFLNTDGNLADRLYTALLAGEAAGGDSRGKQSAAILVVREGAGYGGFTDRAIDIRVDDHPEPFKELGRILKIGQMNYAWNIAWTAFTEDRFEDALEPMERTAQLAPDYAEVHYDLAVIRLAVGDAEGALVAITRAMELNPRLVESAKVDNDLDNLRGLEQFESLLGN